MSLASIDIIAMGRIAPGGGVPVWTWQSGFTGGVTRNAAGDYSVTLEGGGAGALESATIVTPDEAQTATNLTTVGVVCTSATVRRITIVQEDNAVGGDPTIAYDGPVQIMVVKARSV